MSNFTMSEAQLRETYAELGVSSSQELFSSPRLEVDIRQSAVMAQLKPGTFVIRHLDVVLCSTLYKLEATKSTNVPLPFMGRMYREIWVYTILVEDHPSGKPDHYSVSIKGRLTMNRYFTHEEDAIMYHLATHD